MIPLRLVMNAFGPYAGQEVIDFRDLGDRKLFLIYGPTGAGKTTVLDAMCYALYGDTSGDLRSGAHMRSEYASPKDKTYVDFSFAIGTKRYRIERSPEQEIAKKRGTGLKKEGAKAALYAIDDHDEDTAVIATKNVTAEIIRLLGFKSEQFRQVVLLPQGDFRKLLLANSSERQQIMQTLFHTQRYARLQALAKERHDAIQSEYSQTEQAITQQLQAAGVENEEALGAALTTQTAAVEKAKQDLTAANRTRDSYQQTVQDAQVLYSHWQSLKKSKALLQEIQGQAEDIEVKRKQIALLQQAKLLAEPCRTLDAIQEKGVHAGEKEKEASQAVAQATANAQQATQVMQDIVAQEGAYKENSNRLVQLRSLVPKTAAYKECCAAVTKAKTIQDQALHAWQGAVQALIDVRMQWEKCQQTATGYADTLRAYEQAKTAYTTLCERLDTERQLETMAQHLDKLRQEEKTLTARLAQASEKARADAVNYESVQVLFLQGQAAVLADGLGEGMPCPVCGATHHPHLAIRAEHMLQKEDLERCKKIAETSEAARQKLTVESAALDAKIAAETMQYDRLRQQYPVEGTVADWQGRTAAQHETVETLAKRAATQQQAQDQATALQQTVKDKEQAEQALRSEKEAALLAFTKAAESQVKAEEDIPALYRDERVLQHQIEGLSKEITAYEQARETSRAAWTQATTEVARWQEQQTLWQTQVTQLRQEYTDGVKALKARVQAAGFASVTACRQAQQDVPQLEELQRTVDAYTASLQQVQGQIAQEQAVINTQLEPDMEPYQAQLRAYNEQCRILSETVASQQSVVQQLTKTTKAIAAYRIAQEALTEQYKAVGSLYDVISGKTTGVNFERYVLGALLDEVLQVANLRLDEMSRHRYELQRSQAWDDKRVKQIGLDIEVFDNFTGYARPANTLSGGETFLASLSLALGLADVVQAYSGGIHLDTMFIDEGFGTLDGETLDFALKALLELKQGGRLVGIISHVPELRERIDTRLAVHKTDRGSTASFELL